MWNKVIPRKEDRWYLLLYAVLVLGQAMLTNPDAAPSMPIRIAYWCLAIIPAIIRPSWMAGVIVMLYTTSSYGFAYGYMPYENLWYVLFALTAFIANPNLYHFKHYPIPSVLWAIMLYTGAVELLTASSLSSISVIVLLVIILLRINDKDDPIVIERVSIGFAVASSVLSVLFVLFGDRFVTNYEDMYDRLGWTDPNYFGMVISFGSITSLFEIIRRKYHYSWAKWLYLFTIIVSVLVQIMNGSRGAILAVAGSAVVFLLFSKVRTTYKLLIVLAGVGFLSLLYATTSVYDFLIYRIDNDTLSSGSGRIDIWQAKLNEFFQCKPINVLFGLGSDAGLTLGWNIEGRSASGKMGFHSDYLGYLVKYGIIGLLLFLQLLAVPFFQSSRRNKNFPFVLAGMVAVALYALTLEPYSSGGTAYWLFYLYILMISMNKQYMA